MRRLLADSVAPSKAACKAELDSLYDADDALQLCAPGTIVWMGKQGRREGDGATAPVVVVDDPTATFRDLRISSQMFSIHVPQNYFQRCIAGGSA